MTKVTGKFQITLPKRLVDAFGSADYVAREVIQVERIVDYTTKEGLAEHFAKRFGKMAANLLIGTMESWQFR